MKTPSIQVKSLDQCEPGDLVKCRWNGSYRWALCGKEKDARHQLIVLPEGEKRWPEFGYSQSTQVLSYGTDYEFRIDYTGPIELPANNLSEIAGCLLLQDTRWFLRAAPQQGIGHHSCWFDLSEACVVSEPELGKSAAFGAWELHLRTHAAPADRTERVARFKWEKQTNM